MAASLDDQESMKGADQGNMIGQIMAFADQLDWSRSLEFDEMGGFSKIVMCGIGGSAISGDIVTDYLLPRNDVPIMTIRGVNLPNYVDRDTLAIVMSHSGNTQEALDLYKGAMARKCTIAVITSGGKLLENARNDGVPHIIVPSGCQPRASLGYLLGSSALVLEKAGQSSPHSEILRRVPMLRGYLEGMSPSIETGRNTAKKIAMALNGIVPAMYSPRVIRSVALRWQNQINENAKSVAFSGEIPEMNHNQMVGWIEGGKGCRCRPVFLLPKELHPTVRKMTTVTLQMFNEKGLDPMMVQLHGEDHMDNLLTGIVLGDMVSYYMAIQKGVDPSPVEAIKEFKTRIA